MNRGIITISETGAVTIPTAPVWMTQFEIADLFVMLQENTPTCSEYFLVTSVKRFMLYIRIRS